MKARILIVDDNAANLYLMAYLLREAGFEVIVAGNGQEGLDVARAQLPDLIVCDAQMPVMDGYEFARHVKRDPMLADRPLVSVTAYAMAGDREKSLDAGFDAYLSKPIVPEEFARQIAVLLQNGKGCGR
jgi:two-component system cell cycle response regulator